MTLKHINLHLVSDSTGETLGSVSRAVLSQFQNVETTDFIWPLVRNENQLMNVVNGIKKNPGIVLYTILEDELVRKLNKVCFDLNVPCIPVLSRIVSEFSNYLGIKVNNLIGRQHELNDEYFSKVEAISYTISHDDGQSCRDLYNADIVIIGVSRTSKSPTSVYLSCRGYKVANIPFVSIETMPEDVYKVIKPLIVGLVINPEKLVKIRENRIFSMGQSEKTDYIDIESIKKELNESKKLFYKLKCPIIDVTSKSVEETAARIMQLIQERKLNNS